MAAKMFSPIRCRPTLFGVTFRFRLAGTHDLDDPSNLKNIMHIKMQKLNSIYLRCIEDVINHGDLVLDVDQFPNVFLEHDRRLL